MPVLSLITEYVTTVEDQLPANFLVCLWDNFLDWDEHSNSYGLHSLLHARWHSSIAER